MSAAQKEKISIDALRPGHYVDLELPWMSHPFLFSRFLVQSDKEVAVIRTLGLREVTVFPERSKLVHTADTMLAEAPADTAASAEDDAARDELWQQKQELIAQDERFRQERSELATAYQDTLRQITDFARELRHGPANAIRAADTIVTDMVSAFEKTAEVLVNLVNLADANFTTYTHALNVTVLSVLLARNLGLEGEEIHAIGMGALLHDIGKMELPQAIVSKTTRLTPAEEALLRTHPLRGLQMVQKVQMLAPETNAIIEHHHEFLDGSGYPHGLRENRLWLGVRIVAIANLYDNFCNPADASQAISPRDAMAKLYRDYRGRLDDKLVAAFIKAMGIYPPGTIVRLNDDSTGMVVSVDADQLLRPRVILYNPDVPRWNAMMTDLRERPDLEVKEILKPGDCPPELYEYLGISERLGYFYERI